MYKKVAKKYAEDDKPKYVPDVSMLAMQRVTPDGVVEHRCPGCLSKNLKIVDYDLAEGAEKRFGDYKFIKKCNQCGMLCKVIKKVEF